MLPRQVSLVLMLLTVFSASDADAAIIAFSGLPGPNGSIVPTGTPYLEGEFKVTPIDGRWMQMIDSGPTPGVYGNPGPSLWEDTFTATLEVKLASGGLFAFSGIDVWGRTADYTLEGLRNGAVVFTTSADIPSVDWLTVNSPSSAAIDRLLIYAVRDQAEYSNVDNIIVSAVPEPSSGILLGGLLAMLGFGRRIRRKDQRD
jgi:hypothetical protein